MRKPVVMLALLFIGDATLPAIAADASADRLAACARETDERRRLACFDREIPPAKTAPSAAPTAPRPATSATPPAPAPAPAPAQATKSPTLGDEQLRGTARPPDVVEAELNARVKELRKADGSSVMVTLDNGQVWRLMNIELASYLKTGDAVTIRKGSLGSYRLTRDEGHDKNWIRAQRVR